LENGDILVLTHFESQEQIDQIFLYHLDSDGNYLWKKSFASTNIHPLIGPKGGVRIFSIDDYFIIAGYCYWPYPTNPDLKKLRPLFVKVDNQFNEEWILPFGVSDSIVGEAFSLIPLNDSIIMGVGKRRFSEGGETVNNSLLMFFNSNGEELGYNQISNDSVGPGINQNLIYDIERINDTLFFASSAFGEEYQGSPFGEFVIDTTGKIFNKQSRPNTIGVTELTKTFDNKYVVVTNLLEDKADWDILMYKINENLAQDSVYTGNYTYDSLCPYQIQSGIIDVTNCLVVTDVNEIPSPVDYSKDVNNVLIEVYPNPASGNEITFEFQNTGCLASTPPSVPPPGGKAPTLIIYNILGGKVHEERIYQHQGESKIDIRDWHSGMYITLVYMNGEVVGQCKFVVR
jgi:hypothetical protein